MTTAHMRATVVLAELETLGLTVEDLLSAFHQKARPRASGPTFSAYLPSVREAYPPRTRRTYNSYWRLAEELIGDLALVRVVDQYQVCA